MGDSILPCTVPVEDMYLVINPHLRQVAVNPGSSNFPPAIVKFDALQA